MLFDRFKTRAEAVSAEVHRVATRDEALEFVVGMVQRENARAVWADGSLLDGVDRRRLAAGAPGLTFDVTRDAAAADPTA